MFVRKRVLQGLQAAHRLAQRRSLLCPRGQHIESKESLYAVELVVVSFIRTNLRVEILEVTGDPGGVS